MDENFVQQHSYTYNASGIRISKTMTIPLKQVEGSAVDGTMTLDYFLDGNKIISQQDVANKIFFIYGVDGIAGFSIQYNNTEETYYYKKNLQGDIIGLYNSAMVLIAKYEYDAWGNHIVKYLDNSGNFVATESDFCYNDVSNINRFIANKNPFRYRSYYYDFETGLYYLNSRYYDPELGRFINIDDISIINDYKDTFNGLNLFAYCVNNPIMLTDENGRGFWDWLLAIVLVVAVVAIVAVVTIATGGVASTIFIGAGLGAVTSGITSTISQLATGNFSLKQLAVDMFFGALTGAIGGSALGVIGSMAAMGMAGVASSIVGDLAQGEEVNYGKAILNGLFSMALGASAGAQYGLTSTVKGYQTALKGFKQAVQAGQYSLRGGNGVLNLAKYRLNQAIGNLKIASRQKLFTNWISSLSQTNIFFQSIQTLI